MEQQDILSTEIVAREKIQKINKIEKVKKVKRDFQAELK
jgi:hypothetical protein